MKTKILLLQLLIIQSLSHYVQGQVGGLTQTGDMTVCQNSTENYGVVLTSGSTYVWSILDGTGGSGTISNGAAPNNLISVTWTNPGTCQLQVIETHGSCTGLPVTIQVTVLPALVPGTAGSDQTISFNSTPAPITATAPTGGDGSYTYQWESSIDGGVTWDIISGAGSLTYAPGPLTQTTRYRLSQSSFAGCGSVYTNMVIITVESTLVAGTATADQTICYQSTPSAISATEPTGGSGPFTYQWELSVDDGANWAEIPGATGLTYNPGLLTLTTRFRLIQSAGSGFGSVTTNSVTITVQPQVVTSPIWHN